MIAIYLFHKNKFCVRSVNSKRNEKLATDKSPLYMEHQKNAFSDCSSVSNINNLISLFTKTNT